MKFQLPTYNTPDFRSPLFDEAPTVLFEAIRQDGVAPENYHGTSVYPEYFQLERG